MPRHKERLSNIFYCHKSDPGWGAQATDKTEHFKHQCLQTEVSLFCLWLGGSCSSEGVPVLQQHPSHLGNPHRGRGGDVRCTVGLGWAAHVMAACGLSPAHAYKGLNRETPGYIIILSGPSGTGKKVIMDADYTVFIFFFFLNTHSNPKMGWFHNPSSPVPNVHRDLHKQELQDLVKGKTCTAYSCK